MSELTKKSTLFIKLKAKITAANKVVKDLTSEAFKLEGELIKEYSKLKQDGIVVKTGTIKIKETDVFNIEDVVLLRREILKSKNFDAIQMRLSNKHLTLVYEDTGKAFKGTKHGTKKTLQITGKK